MDHLTGGRAKAVAHSINASKLAKAEDEAEAYVESLSNATRDADHRERGEAVTEGAEAEAAARAPACLASIVRRAAAEVARRAAAEVAGKVAAFVVSQRTKTRDAELPHARIGAKMLLAVRVINVAGVAVAAKLTAVPAHAAAALVAAVAVASSPRNQVYQGRSWV